MACANEHRAFNLVAVSVAAALVEGRDGRPLTAAPVAMGITAACFPSLPDLLEPALHPNHRKFFHSWAVVGLLGWGMYGLYDWQPDDGWDRFARVAGLALGAAYLAHLARDAFTAKSLPLI